MLAAKEFFAWCCVVLRAINTIIKIIPSGSITRGTRIRPLHDIDALVLFDLNGLRKVGVHNGTNLPLLFLGDILKCLAPQHQLSSEHEWSYVAPVDDRNISLRHQGYSVGACIGSR